MRSSFPLRVDVEVLLSLPFERGEMVKNAFFSSPPPPPPRQAPLPLSAFLNAVFVKDSDAVSPILFVNGFAAGRSSLYD